MRTRTFQMSSGRTVTRPRSYHVCYVLLFFIAVFIAAKVTGFRFTVLQERGMEFFVLFRKMIPPAWGDTKEIIEPLLDTIKMSFAGSFAGSVLVIPFAILASMNIVRQKAIVAAVRFVLSLIRTLPTLVIALIATYIFGLGVMAGTLAIGIFTFSYVGKILYEEIETVDMGAYEAMEAIGCGKVRAFFSAIFPQVLPGYLSSCLFCFEGNVRYASILGYVGAGGIGLILNEKIGWRQYGSVGMIILLLFGTVFIIEAFSYYLRTKLT